MELDFFKSKLKEKGILTIISDEQDRKFVHNTIFEELGKGIINPETKLKYLQIIEKLIENGAERIILGCTEIPLIVKENDVKVPTFDTTLLHSKSAIEFVLN
tara:strand:- start:2091 stop:2396 length:306 start_codon:yes stop_codon:yes gene_type:complete